MAGSIVIFACVCFFVCALSSAQDVPVPCVCVWFYLCPNGTLDKHGTGLINARGSMRPVCNETGHVCCPMGQDQQERQESTPPGQSLNTTTILPPEELDTGPDDVTDDIPWDVMDPHEGITEKPEPKPFPVVVPQPGCGVKRVSLDARISFSKDDESIASFAEFPWMLAVLNANAHGSYDFKCGASLIDKQVALTAAHCVHRLPAASLRIRAGEWNTGKTGGPMPHQTRNVRHIELHPFYNNADLRHDLALIYLDHPFDLTDNVDTICLPHPNSIFHGQRCTATGWGKKDPADVNVAFRNILRKVDLPIVPSTECENRLRSTRLGRYFELHHSFLCAGGELEKDSCKGDGGGPLVCPTDKENRWVQAGIVSWGIGCGSTAPGVYTDVSAHSEWIHRRLQKLHQRRPVIPQRHFYRLS